jgi:hypothetical protein
MISEEEDETQSEELSEKAIAAELELALEQLQKHDKVVSTGTIEIDSILDTELQDAALTLIKIVELSPRYPYDIQGYYNGSLRFDSPHLWDSKANFISMAPAGIALQLGKMTNGYIELKFNSTGLHQIHIKFKALTSMRTTFTVNIPGQMARTHTSASPMYLETFVGLHSAKTADELITVEFHCSGGFAVFESVVLYHVQ